MYVWFGCCIEENQYRSIVYIKHGYESNGQDPKLAGNGAKLRLVCDRVRKKLQCLRAHTAEVFSREDEAISETLAGGTTPTAGG